MRKFFVWLLIFGVVGAGVYWFWTDAVVVFEQAKTGGVFWFADLDFDFDVDIFGFLGLDSVRFFVGGLVGWFLAWAFASKFWFWGE